VAASRRGCTRETETEGCGVKVINDNEIEEEDSDGVVWVGDEAAALSEAEVEAAACSKAGDQAVACFGVGIEDDRRRWHRQ
jgi:hypothetical protein